MIIKDINYGKAHDVVIIKMGMGDILMVRSLKDENGSVHLALKTIEEPLPMNTTINSDEQIKPCDEFYPEVVFIFNNIDSLNSLIDMLQDCKKEILYYERPRIKRDD